MKRFNPGEIEPKWQQTWADSARYVAKDFDEREKFYISCMFPYPSAAGMHCGHAMEHAIVDAIARFQRAHGKNVMNPMGWDSFGLPAENYAIKTGTAPAVVTKENIANFKVQLNRLGASIDWSRELNTSDPEYYRWTQWVFTQLFEKELAYQKESLQWWCPVDKTVLANEQVEGGHCWRCGSVVEKKSMKQWFFKITDYADQLLDEIPNLDWPDKIKTAQTNWIGRSQGAEIDFKTETDDTITVFTTRPDTIFGATFLVIAPEHKLVETLITVNQESEVRNYVTEAVKKTEIDRMAEGKEKTGVFTGSYAVNPANGEKIPIWVADYVLGTYGTGAIMAVPAHDERDNEFAKKFGLQIKQVVASRFVDPNSPFRDDKELISRNVITCIFKNPEDDTYLVAKPKGGSTWAPLMGGIDEGETATQAATREVTEETGFTDVGVVEPRGEIISSEFYAEHKNVNRIAYCQPVYVELLSLQKDAKKAIDADDQEFKWVTKDEYYALENAAISNEHVFDTLHMDKIAFTSEGRMINSGPFDGRTSSEVREEIAGWLEEQEIGRAKTTYKMRDWLISRQRYWGAPIPVIHCDEHGAVPVPADQLPVILPHVDDYAPKGDGKSVLASVEDWVNTSCPTCGGPAKRETDTMDGYACSSWYLLRYTDPQNAEQAWNPKNANYWSPVDYYVGGDHAVAHLLYVRFWNHVFKDLNLVPTVEPVKKLVYHGLIQAEDGRKMSKSLGNVIDPLDVIDQGYGADALRTFLLFLGPINENSNWSTRGIAGIHRFLSRVWTLTNEYLDSEKAESLDTDVALRTLQHKTIKKVTGDYDRMSFNTAIAAMMECTNELYKLKTNGFSTAWQDTLSSIVQLLAPTAPHMAAELWEMLGNGDQLDTAPWPKWDDEFIKEDMMTIVVQVNGKVRAKLSLAAGSDEATVKSAVLTDDSVKKNLDNKEPAKVIYVPGRLVNIVL